MGWREWIIAGAVVTFAGGQIVPAYTHPLDSKKHFHTQVEGEYMHVGTTGDIVTVLGSGTIDTRITPGSGTLTLEGGQSRVV